MIRARNTVEAQTANLTASKGLRSKLQRRPLSKDRGAASGHDIIQDKDASWNVRRKVAALLRKAFRVVFMGQQRSLGRLSGGGAAVTALLMSMGLMLATPASAQQFAVGGSTSES